MEIRHNIYEKINLLCMLLSITRSCISLRVSDNRFLRNDLRLRFPQTELNDLLSNGNSHKDFNYGIAYYQFSSNINTQMHH